MSDAITFKNGRYVEKRPWTVEAFWYGDKSDYDDLVEFLKKNYKYFKTEHLYKDRWDQFGNHWGTLAYCFVGCTNIFLGSIVTISYDAIRTFHMKDFNETFELVKEVE